MTTQFLFRGIYTFRNAVLHGSFDRDLLIPVNPLFSALMTAIDFLDLPLWLVTTGLLVNSLTSYSLLQLGVFILLVINGLVIITGIHILVAALAILFTTADQLINIYRDFSAMARFPIDIYAYPVRLLLNTLLPIGIAFTLPANILFGRSSIQIGIYGVGIGVVFVMVALALWQRALTQYSSASS